MRSLRFRLAVALLRCAVLGLPTLAHAAVGLTGWSGSGFSAVNDNAGFEFSTTSSINITDLGFFDQSVNGLGASHEVGIWRVSDQSLMVSGTVASGTGAPLDGDYRYVAVTPTVLAPGNYIVSAVTTGDNWLTNLVTPIVSGPLTYVSGRDTFPDETASLVYPNQAAGNNHAPANFKYQAAIGLTGWSGAGYSGVDNNAGFEFSTTSPITINELGFSHRVVGGLAASHEVGIWRVSDQTLLVSGTVASGTAAPLDNDYRYVAVTSTLLTPGNYIVSAVTTGEITGWRTNLVTPIMSGPLTYVQPRSISPAETVLLVYPSQVPGNKHAPANFKYDLAPTLTLTNGGVVLGSLPIIGDEDYYEFTAALGDKIELRMASQDLLYPEIELRDPNSAIVGTNSDCCVAAVEHTVVDPGTFGVIVRDGLGDRVGDYQLYFTRIPGANELGAPLNGPVNQETIDPGDLDIYTFVANVGDQITLRSGRASGNLYPELKLYDPLGVLIGQDTDASDAFVQSTAAVTGIYTLQVDSSVVRNSGDYNLHLARIPGANELGELLNGPVNQDTIDLGDLDTYTFVANVGDQITLRSGRASGGLYPQLKLYDPLGVLVGQDTDASDAFVQSTAAVTGIYTLLFDSSLARNFGDYDIHLARIPGVNELGELLNGPVNQETIDLGDLDTYTFVANVGDHITLRSGRASGGLYPQLKLYDPSGVLVAQGTDASDAFVQSTAAVTGIYTLLFDSSLARNFGDYDIHLARIPGVVENDFLVDGLAYPGELTLGDLDTFVFPANVGDNITLDLMLLTGAFYSSIELYTPSGVLADSSTVAGTASVAHQTTESGLYTVLVQDGLGRRTGTYSLAFTSDGGPFDSDTDGDGLLDAFEVANGFNPFVAGEQNADPDADGLSNLAEQAAGTDPLDPDDDGDGVCDGAGTGGGACSAGPDNCPLVPNGSQTNSDSLSAGDDCQCGDVDNDGSVTLADVTRAQENLLGLPLGGTFDATRCNVIGPSDGGVSDCDIADIFILQRFLTGSPVSVENTCDAYSAP